MKTPDANDQMHANPFDLQSKYYVHLTRPAVDMVKTDGLRVTYIRPGGGKSRVMDTLLAEFVKSSNGAK